MKRAGIYRIVARFPGGAKFYFGQASNLGHRKVEHFYSLRKNTHYNVDLQAAFNDLGDLDFEIVVICSADRSILRLYEQAFIDACDPVALINIRRKCCSSPLGTKQSAESNAKRSATLLGRKRTPEEIARSASSRTGKTRTPESRERMAQAKRGRKLSPEHRIKVVAALSLSRTARGPITADTRVKMRLAARNRRKSLT